MSNYIVYMKGHLPTSAGCRLFTATILAAMTILLRLSTLLAPTGHQVQHVDTDEVFPVHYLDRVGLVRTSITSYTFRYNAVLDVEQLHSSLVRLLEMGDWRKLGGRLRLDKNGTPEIHVPREYTIERPAVRFSHAAFNIPIEEHPQGCCLPKNTRKMPSIQKGCYAFRCFSVPQDLPNNIEHYLTTDEPLISLYITSFADATLVSLTFPHSLLDAMGTAELLKAWSSLLAGRLDRVPTVLGARTDVIKEVGSSSDHQVQVPYVLRDHQLRGLSMLTFAARFGWDLLTRKTIQARTIFLPANFISYLRQRAHEQLAFGSSCKGSPFLSDGDLITAWCSRAIMSSRSRKRPATILNLFDLRTRLNNTFVPGASYLQNLVLPTCGFVQPGASTGQIALGIREAIVEQATDAQARSLMKTTRASFASSGFMPLFGKSNSMVIVCTSWSKARFLEAADFSPAVIPNSSGGSSQELKGSCVSYWGAVMSKTDKPRDTLIIYGKDRGGNYWVHAYLRPETWDLIEDEFSRFVLKGK